VAAVVAAVLTVPFFQQAALVVDAAANLGRAARATRQGSGGEGGDKSGGYGRGFLRLFHCRQVAFGMAESTNAMDDGSSPRLLLKI
jgi:hypothetical protein